MIFLLTGIFENEGGSGLGEHGPYQEVGCIGRVPDPKRTADGKIRRAGVNFINIFHMKVLSAAFLLLQFGFVIFCRKIIGAKAAHKMLMKLTTNESKTFTISIYISI